MFFKIEDTFSLRSHVLHKEGKIVGMDAASAATVWALNLEHGQTCLDLCCAPGMKLSLISDFIGTDKVTGTDVSEHRLDVCYNLLGKLGYNQVRDHLFHVAENESLPSCTPFNSIRHWRKSRNRKKKRRVESNDEVVDPLTLSYDRVLVDTECSHDGSVRHVAKHEAQEGDTRVAHQGFWAKHASKDDKNRERYTSESELAKLVNLQRKLIRRGFERLKPGGILVYSTCSLQSAQNQGVVESLLEEFPGVAKPGILPFRCLNDQDAVSKPLVPANRVSECSCLFEPLTSGTSGQFIAVVVKAS